MVNVSFDDANLRTDLQSFFPNTSQLQHSPSTKKVLMASIAAQVFMTSDILVIVQRKVTKCQQTPTVLLLLSLLISSVSVVHRLQRPLAALPSICKPFNSNLIRKSCSSNSFGCEMWQPSSLKMSNLLRRPFQSQQAWSSSQATLT